MFGFVRGSFRFVRGLLGVRSGVRSVVRSGFVWGSFGACFEFVWGLFGVRLGFVWGSFGVGSGFGLVFFSIFGLLTAGLNLYFLP